jgi:hypothetical protein
VLFDTDSFTFSGLAGEVIVVNFTFVCVTLVAPSGASVDACGSVHRLDAVLSETGTFTLTTRVQPVSLANYTLALERLLPASPRARTLSYGETLSDTINVVADIDVFSFTAGAGDTVSIFSSTAAIMPPCIQLIAPDNTRTNACGFGQTNRIEILLPQAGTYSILVRQGDTIGFSTAWTYSLELQCLSGACLSAPNPPTGLTGMVSGLSTTLTWNAPTMGRPPTAYVIEAGTAPGAVNVMAFDTMSTATTFTAPGVPNGTYFVRVKSRNSIGTSGPSNEITISGASGCPLPSAPGNFAATAAGNIVTFQWSAATGNPTSYILEAGTSAGASNLVSIDLGSTTQLVTPAPNGTFFVRMRARNACGVGPASNEVTLIVGCSGPPSPPASLVASVSGSTVMLSWSVAAGQPVGYVVEVGTASGLSNIARLPVGSRLSVVGNAPAGTYFIRVKAVNSCGISGPSIERSVVVP